MGWAKQGCRIRRDGILACAVNMRYRYVYDTGAATTSLRLLSAAVASATSSCGSTLTANTWKRYHTETDPSQPRPARASRAELLGEKVSPVKCARRGWGPDRAGSGGGT